MEHQGYFLTNLNGENLMPLKFYTAANYSRFSREDGDNTSIATQNMILEKYCNDNGYRGYDYYEDDGYTGLNFNRPNFQRMLTDIEAGEINLVITKD